MSREKGSMNVGPVQRAAGSRTRLLMDVKGKIQGQWPLGTKGGMRDRRTQQ